MRVYQGEVLDGDVHLFYRDEEVGAEVEITDPEVLKAGIRFLMKGIPDAQGVITLKEGQAKVIDSVLAAKERQALEAEVDAWNEAATRTLAKLEETPIPGREEASKRGKVIPLFSRK